MSAHRMVTELSDHNGMPFNTPLINRRPPRLRGPTIGITGAETAQRRPTIAVANRSTARDEGTTETAAVAVAPVAPVESDDDEEHEQ